MSLLEILSLGSIFRAWSIQCLVQIKAQARGLSLWLQLKERIKGRAAFWWFFLCVGGIWKASCPKQDESDPRWLSQLVAPVGFAVGWNSSEPELWGHRHLKGVLLHCKRGPQLQAFNWCKLKIPTFRLRWWASLNIRIVFITQCRYFKSQSSVALT